jgi:hypothetical protein
MALRDRQLGGIPLSKDNAFLVTFLGAFCVILIAYLFWFPLLGVPQEIRKYVAGFGAALYILLCSGRVHQGKERAQLFMGTYTGISFPAGIYLLPKLPFPIITLLINLLLSKDVSDYLGWTLEGDVNVKSIALKITSEGMTSDGVVVELKGTLSLEVENAAVYLSQSEGKGGDESLLSIIGAECSAQIKREVIARNPVKNLLKGDYHAEYLGVNEQITEACALIKDFGLSLARSPLVTVHIVSDRIRASVDNLAAKQILDDSSKALATRFRKFHKRLGPNVSEETALILFNLDQIDNGGPTLNMNTLKLK